MNDRRWGTGIGIPAVVPLIQERDVHWDFVLMALGSSCGLNAAASMAESAFVPQGRVADRLVLDECPGAKTSAERGCHDIGIGQGQIPREGGGQGPRIPVASGLCAGLGCDAVRATALCVAEPGRAWRDLAKRQPDFRCGRGERLIAPQHVSLGEGCYGSRWFGPTR